MKAFLSHSSRDKGIVEQVAKILRGANVELDSTTFDQGLINVIAIEQALNRSSLFALFLSKDAIESGFVHYEAVMAKELHARGVIEKFLVICLDEDSFSSSGEQWKSYNFVRNVGSAQSIARLIQSSLIILRSKSSLEGQPFVGRGKELNDAKERLIDPLLPTVRAIFISGNAGIGRRTFARQLYRDVFPAANKVFPEINIEKLDGYEEIYRKINAVATPFSSMSALRARIAGFSLEKENGKAQLASMRLGS